MYWTDGSWVEPMFDFHFGMEFRFYDAEPGEDQLSAAAQMSDQLHCMAYGLLDATNQIRQFGCPECGDIGCGGFAVHRLWGNQKGFVMLCSGGQHPHGHPILCMVEITQPGTVMSLQRENTRLHQAVVLTERNWMRAEEEARALTAENRKLHDGLNVLMLKGKKGGKR